MYAETQMEELFNVYYEQCPHERIKYTASELRFGNMQSWIVMDGLELSYMMYQGEYRIVFMRNRYSNEHGNDTYYFSSYEECMKVHSMSDEVFNQYADSLK